MEQINEIGMIFSREGFFSRNHHVASGCDILMQLKLPSAHCICGKISYSPVRWWSEAKMTVFAWSRDPLGYTSGRALKWTTILVFNKNCACYTPQQHNPQINQEAAIDCHQLLQEWRSCYMCVQPDNPLNFCHGNCGFKCAESKYKNITTFMDCILEKEKKRKEN